MGYGKVSPSLRAAILRDGMGFGEVVLIEEIMQLCRGSGVCTMSGARMARERLFRSTDQYENLRGQLIAAGYITKERVTKRRTTIRLTQKTLSLMEQDGITSAEYSPLSGGKATDASSENTPLSNAPSSEDTPLSVGSIFPTNTIKNNRAAPAFEGGAPCEKNTPAPDGYEVVSRNKDGTTTLRNRKTGELIDCEL